MVEKLLDTPLTKTNLIALDDFLEKNQLPVVFVLYGTFAALVSGPYFIEPNEWLGFLGLNQVTFNSKKEVKQIMGTIIGLYNSIAQRFLKETFSVFDTDENLKEISIAKSLWALGYMMGVNFFGDTWGSDLDALSLTLPILNLTMPDEQLAKFIVETKLNTTPETLRKKYEAELTHTANEIYKYWNEKSDLYNESSVNVGKNDPCFCGSGRKFEKCCLN